MRVNLCVRTLSFDTTSYLEVEVATKFQALILASYSSTTAPYSANATRNSRASTIGPRDRPRQRQSSIWAATSATSNVVRNKRTDAASSVPAVAAKPLSQEGRRAVQAARVAHDAAALAAMDAAGQRPTISVIQQPCCGFCWHDRVLDAPPDHEYLDARIAASARSVRVWEDVSAGFDFRQSAVGRGVPRRSRDLRVSNARKRGEAVKQFMVRASECTECTPP